MEHEVISGANQLNGESNNKVVAVLGVGHVVNDSYMNFFQPLIPLLIATMGLSLSQVGLITAFFSVTSSVSQIIIGGVTDRFGTRAFVYLGPLLAAVMMSSIGLIDNFVLLLIAVSLAGLGIAAFHPPASAIVGHTNTRNSGRAMSLFSLGGNVGFAAMPLIVVPLVAAFGLSATPVLALPGVAVAILLYRLTPRIHDSGKRVGEPFFRTVRSQPVAFVGLLGTVAFRSLAFFSLITFLPILLAERGYSLVAGGAILSVLALSGAFGGLLGGLLSDRTGPRPVIIGSLLAAVPFLMLALYSSGVMLIVGLGLAGASLLASFSVAVVAAQRIFPDNKATASSLALGFGLGLGGLGVGLISSVADAFGFGIEQTLFYVSFLPIVAAAFALGLPGKRVG
ncbi:MAG: MFS transporter [Actinomycetota bacterium]|nr:MFS transporter [Actinomycetota bacterium]